LNKNKNQYEVQLLLNKPNELVAHYQSIIEVVVSKFVSRGFFDVAEKKDVVQNINEALLERKMGSIQRNYNGSVLLSTYFSKVIYNHCLEITRSKKNQTRIGSEDLLQNHSDTNVSAENQLILKDEINRIEIVLKGVIGLSLRVLIALKLYARVPLTMTDFQGKMIQEDDLFNDFKKDFFNPFDELNDKEVYVKAIPFLNKLTSKNTDADSMRKWVNMQIDKIIQLQDGEPPRSKHSRDTIRILLQMFFEK